MVKINIVGKNPKQIEALKKKLEDFKVDYSEQDPDLVVCYGGDGMFLIAERMFPNIPKILIKGSKVSNRGHKVKIRDAIKMYLDKKYSIQNLIKIKATKKGYFETRKLIAVNDIVIRNTLPTEAVRFRIKINEKYFGDEFIGDGAVVSTPYGSGAYYSSITKKTFEEGIGIALNNIVGNFGPILLNENDKIEIEILRGPGVLVADNNRDYINLEKGDSILIEVLKDFAKRIILDK